MVPRDIGARSWDKPINWFLIRGLTREGRHWGDFPSVLQEVFPNATIQTLNLPGAGDRNHEKSPYSMRAIARDVRAQALFPTDGRPNYIIAISMGAMVAMEWLKEHPTGLNGAVFMNTSLNILSPFWERLRPKNYLRVLKIALCQSTMERERLTLQSILRIKSPEPLVAEWTSWAESHPMSTRNRLAQLSAAITYGGSLEAPPRPILLLRSLADQLVHPKATARIARAWNMPMSTHPSAGHDLPTEDPHWICEQLIRYLGIESIDQLKA